MSERETEIAEGKEAEIENEIEKEAERAAIPRRDPEDTLHRPIERESIRQNPPEIRRRTPPDPRFPDLLAAQRPTNSPSTSTDGCSKKKSN